MVAMTHTRGLRRVLLVEANNDGHRFWYVRLLAEYALANGDFVGIVLRTGAQDSEEFRLHLVHLLPFVHIEESTSFEAKDIARISTRFGSTVTVVPDGDALAYNIARLGRWPATCTLSILIMRGTAPKHPKVLGLGLVRTAVKQLVFWRLRTMPRVRIAVLGQPTSPSSRFFPTAPDPVQMLAEAPDAAALAERWALDPSRYWFAILGTISERKNPHLILQSLITSGQEDFGLLLAGAFEDGLKEKLAPLVQECEESGCTIRIVDRLLSDLELDAAIRAIDCIVLAHSNEGPSGILGKCAVAGTRVIGAGARSLREAAKHLQDLMTWTPLNSAELSKAMVHASNLPQPQAIAGLDTYQFAESLIH